MKRPVIFKPRHAVVSAMTLLIMVMGHLIFQPAVFAEQPADDLLEEELREKDLLIRNLRRTIFDLETQLSGQSNKSQLLETNRQLRQELKAQKNSIQDGYSIRMTELQQTVKQLKKQLESLQKEKESLMSSRDSAHQNQIADYERLIREKTEQLNKANELVAKIVAEKTSGDERISLLTNELKEKNKTLEELEGKYKEVKTRQDQAILKAQKPLNEKITELEDNIKTVRQQALTNEEKAESESNNLKKKYEEEIKTLTRKLKEKEDLVSQKEKDIDQLNGRIRSAESASAQTIEDLNKTLAARDKKSAETQKKLDGHDEEIKQLKAGHKKETDLLGAQLKEKEQSLASSQADVEKRTEELNTVKKELQAKEEMIAALSAENKNAAKPFLEKITGLEKQLNEKDLAFKLKEDEAVQIRTRLTDETEKNAVYKRLVDQQDGELAELRKGLDTRQDQLAKQMEEAKTPLQEKIGLLEKQVSDFDRKLSEERFNAKIESKADFDRISNELSALKIDNEYKQAQLLKLAEEKSGLEEQLQIIAEKNTQLSLSLEELNQFKNNNSFSISEHTDLKNKNTELNERLEILLQENAAFQKKMAEVTTQLQEAAEAKAMAGELKEARNLIQGFKKDADAKTIEIAGLSDENHALRMKLKQTLKDSEILNQEIAKLKQHSAAGIDKAEYAKLKEQTDSLKTALSKARQMIAQKDVEVEDVIKDRDRLKNDIVLLTDQMNIKIQQLGEIDYANRNKEKMYTEKELTQMKTPLMTEITALKGRITELEQQLVETWSRTESMLIELKNHPTIKQADSQLYLEDFKPAR
ncbi:MAG: hypothetical protein AB7S78_12740 [Candidatus Omnitrophota bacterium]